MPLPLHTVELQSQEVVLVLTPVNTGECLILSLSLSLSLSITHTHTHTHTHKHTGVLQQQMVVDALTPGHATNCGLLLALELMSKQESLFSLN